MKKGEGFAIIGAPGIGKTLSTSFLLMSFIREMGKPDAVNHITCRIHEYFFDFICSPETQLITVQCSACLKVENLKALLTSRQDSFCSEDVPEGWIGKLVSFVMFIEEEQEETFSSYGPILMTASSRNADRLLKAFTKGGGPVLTILGLEVRYLRRLLC
jgi:hypothetical protein